MQKALNIGYLWQYEDADLTQIAATPLHIKAVCEALRARDHRVRLLTFDRGQPKVAADEAFRQWEPVRLPVTTGRYFRSVESPLRYLQTRLSVPYIRLFDSLRYAEAVYRSLKDCQVLYERHWLHSYGGLLAARRLGVPLILEVNGDILQEYKQLNMELSTAQWRALRFIIARIFRHADHLVAVSAPLRDALLAEWSLKPDRVTVVPNGVAASRFARVTAAEIAAARQQYQLNGAPIVAFVGTFKPWHGLDRLLDAFAAVAKQRPARLLLIGDGPLRQQLEAQARALQIESQLTLTGLVPPERVPALLQAADVAVLSPQATPAARAQSPMKLFEYMAAGRAVVAPALPNIEAILEHGQNGYLVPVGDVEALGSAISTLLGDEGLRERLGETARVQAEKHHSWDATAEAIESIMYRRRASRE